MTNPDGRLPLPPEDASTAERVAWAQEMRVKGHPWQEIATYLGTTEGTLQVDATKAIQRAATEWDSTNKSYALALFMSRLEYMIHKLMPAIDQGDTKAIDSATRVTAQQIKLLKLEDADTDEKPKTIIVRGSTEEYVAQLKLVRGEKDE